MCSLIDWFTIKHKDCEEKRSYPNPTYEIIVDESAAGNATQLLNHSQTHNTFNIGNDQGKIKQTVKTPSVSFHNDKHKHMYTAWEVTVANTERQACSNTYKSYS